ADDDLAGAGNGIRPGRLEREDLRPAVPVDDDRAHAGYSAEATASPTAAVDASPPRSGVRGDPRLSTAATAASIRRAPASAAAAGACGGPSQSSIRPADRMVARGLAMPLSAMSGAVP